jgi:hypothetical protein
LWYYSSRALKKKTIACKIFPTSILALHFEFYFFNPKFIFLIFILDLKERKKKTNKEGEGNDWLFISNKQKN